MTPPKTTSLSIAVSLAVIFLLLNCPAYASHIVTDTGQVTCFDNTSVITCPLAGANYYGQDSQYDGAAASYTDNGDGAISDVNTSLMWTQTPDLDGDGDIDSDDKLTFDEAVAFAGTLNRANYQGHDDWRLPNIKELYSLMDFRGTEPTMCSSVAACPNLKPFIDTNFFEFGYGDTSAGERLIDAQMVSSTMYVSTTMHGDATAFGVNFADGRIKGYGLEMPNGSEKYFYVYYVRGNTDHSVNKFVDNGDGTITDRATGLMWQQGDSEEGLNWQEGLEYAEGLSLAGYDDWRMPNAKELQSIVDYTRSPATTGTAAIDPVFNVTSITDEGGYANYPFYWTSTTHESYNGNGNYAAYVCFGEALGWMQAPFPPYDYSLLDVHGAGAQRSDPKSGDPANYPYGHGPQGDVIRIYNYVRCVRGASNPFCQGLADGGDINCDCGVDYFDFARLAQHWLETDCQDCSGADLTGDGNVDIDDLAKQCMIWLSKI
jgi:hypothetical protein